VTDELHVYLHDKHIGTILRIPRERSVRFELDDHYDGAVSALSEGFSLIAGRPFAPPPISNFLGGYLPEGKHRENLAGKRGIDETDLFGFLESYGLTMAGALSIRTDDPADDTTPDYRALNDSELKKKAEKSLSDYDLGNEPHSGRSTLPGFQPKLLLARFHDQWYQPLRRAHSTHIVKPELARRPAAIHDEFYAHELSRQMGLSSFGNEIVHLNGMRLLSIERYDRQVLDNHTVKAIHQEDAAQALGLDWIRSTSKFQDPSRPSRTDRPTAARIAELFGSIGDGADIEQWLRYLTFTILIVNHDGHANNVSLIHNGADTRIADIYDAVPILHINDDPARAGSAKIEDELSLSVNGVFTHHKLTRADIQAEAELWGAMSSARVASIINDTFERFGEAIDQVQLPPRTSPYLLPHLHHNLEHLVAGARIGKPK
jgi:serine/threonine-protein kinase HipA